MRIGALAEKNGWSPSDLEEYAKKEFGEYVKEGMFGTSIDDSVAGELESGFAARKEEAEAAAKAKARVNPEFMTTGSDFNGYRIVKYLGLVSGDSMMGKGLMSSLAAGFSDLVGVESEMHGNMITQVKGLAVDALAVNARKLGANAVIGVDFDVFTLNGLIGFSANGTAVVVERET